MRITNIENKLADEYLKTLAVPRENLSSPIEIGMIGLPGSGKSYIAKKIAEKLNIYLFSTDKIRRFLNKNGYPGISPSQDIVDYISNRITRFLRENKISYIADSDVIKYLNKVRVKSKRYGTNFVLVDVACSEKEILNRINQRKIKDGDNYSAAGTKRYYERKKLHSKLPKPRKIFYTFDSEGDVDKQVNDFADKLNKYLNI